MLAVDRALLLQGMSQDEKTSATSFKFPFSLAMCRLLLQLSKAEEDYEVF
jgi:hypothetical protein